MPGYDFIGDVHGQYGALVRLLAELGYREGDGVYRHPERIAVFIGDLVARPEVRRTLRLVPACARPDALCQLGNHEYNLALAHPRPNGGGCASTTKITATSCSPRSIPSSRETEQADNREWLLALPLLSHLREFRAVHACWDHWPFGLLVLTAAAIRRPVSARPCWSVSRPSDGQALPVLKGLKNPFPAGLCFTDSRLLPTEKRVRCWRTLGGKSYEELFVLSCTIAG
jgi:hypothetical protein